MASHVAAGDTIQWSEETFTLREVVTKVGLPTMVKVSEGIYTDNEAETFSYGDLLKLEFVKSIRKVSAKLIGIGDGGSLINIEKTLRNPQKYDKMTKEVLIPLGYKGRVELIKPRRKLYTVGQIMEEFPKNIRTETALFVNDKDPPVHLPPGIHLQVDKIIPNRGIVCKNKKNDVTLYKEQKGKFSIIEDERTYTLEEVVECFQFPQFVRFVDTNFEAVETSNLHEAIENIKQFRGILQLTREVIQNVVVGHHKPLSDGRYKGEPRVRSLALLPLDSISQQMIVFNVPIYCDPEEYQLVMARNFSENVDMSSIEGVLYLEFAKDPKVHLFRTGSEEEQTIDLPERKFTKGYSTQMEDSTCMTSDEMNKKEKTLLPNSTISNADDSDDYDYPDVRLLLNQKKRKSVQKAAISFCDSDNGTHRVQTSDDTQKLADNEKHLQKTTEPLFQEKRKKQLPKLGENDNDTEKVAEYDYPDLPCVKPPRPVPRVRSKFNVLDGKKHRTVASVTPSLSDHSRAKVAPDIPREPVSEDQFASTKRFSQLTVEEVCKCFKACGLTDVAKVCEREMLDGAFLNELSVDELEKELFNLTPIQVKKIERIKMGWRPKTEKIKSKSFNLN